MILKVSCFYEIAELERMWTSKRERESARERKGKREREIIRTKLSEETGGRK